MTEYLEKIRNLISNKCGVDKSEITPNSFFEDDLNIGEIELLEILEDLEETFKVELITEKENIKSVSDLLTVLADKLE